MGKPQRPARKREDVCISNVSFVRGFSGPWYFSLAPSQFSEINLYCILTSQKQEFQNLTWRVVAGACLGLSWPPSGRRRSREVCLFSPSLPSTGERLWAPEGLPLIGQGDAGPHHMSSVDNCSTPPVTCWNLPLGCGAPLPILIDLSLLVSSFHLAFEHLFSAGQYTMVDY